MPALCPQALEDKVIRSCHRNQKLMNADELMNCTSPTPCSARTSYDCEEKTLALHAPFGQTIGNESRKYHCFLSELHTTHALQSKTYSILVKSSGSAHLPSRADRLRKPFLRRQSHVLWLWPSNNIAEPALDDRLLMKSKDTVTPCFSSPVLICG